MKETNIIRECLCPHCIQEKNHPDKILHRQLNLIFSRLNEQQRRWLAAFEATRLGWGGAQLMSLIVGVSRVTIHRGLAELKARLKDRPHEHARLPGGGRKPKLTEDQVQEIGAFLSQGATAHGWVNDLWTAKRVAILIKKQFNKDLCLPTVRKVLNERLEWSLQKPACQLRNRDDEEINRWKAEEFPRILAQARARNAYVVFIDESGFMLEPTRRRTYAPRGQAPVVKVSDPHAKISVIGAITVAPKSEQANFFFDMLADNKNYYGKDIVDFLRFLYKRVPQPMTIIWDKIRIHLSRVVEGHLLSNCDIISEPFPANASELNPVDSVWSHVKYARLANYAPPDLWELRVTLKKELGLLHAQSKLLHSFISRCELKLM